MSTETTSTTTDDDTHALSQMTHAHDDGVIRTRDGRILPPLPESPEPRPGKPRTGGLFPRLRSRTSGGDLSDADAERLRTVVSDDPVPLPADEDGNETAAPCRACGIAVPLPTDREGRAALEHRDVQTPSGRTWRQTLAVCGPCAGVRADAVVLVAAHPALRARHGPVVVDRLESALVVFAALSRPLPRPDAATTTRADVERLLRFLATPGAAVCWSTRCHEAPGYAAPYPWAHVRETDRAALRRGLADLMADRLAMTAEPVFLAPPALTGDDPRDGSTARTIPVQGGCLLCGVGAVALAAVTVARSGGRERAEREVWTARRWSPGSLGGRPSPATVVGHTCPACSSAVTHAGAIGPSALERAVTEHLRVSGKWDESRDALTNLKGWGALAADALRSDAAPPPPNLTPWSHVANLPTLAEHLTRRG
ncbi:MAG: hypothetical protein Q8Q02_12560 [Nocardioides sp.]|nr:hypothetical protein [Nocardioides sp.]